MFDIIIKYIFFFKRFLNNNQIINPQKMNILLLYAQLPYSNPKSGSQVYIFNFIKYFSTNHKIFLLCIGEKEFLHYSKEIKRYCNEVVVVQRTETKLSNFHKYLKTFFSKNPTIIEMNYYPELDVAFKRIIKNNKIDLIYCERIIMFSYIKINQKLLENIRIYIREDALAYLELSTIISFRLKQFIKSYKYIFNDILNFKMNFVQIVNNFTNLIISCRYRKVKKYQISAWKNADFISTLNLMEKQYIKKNYNKNVKIYPHGVKLSKFDEHEEERELNSLVFLGNYSYSPNVQGINYFLRKIFPKLKKNHKNIKLYIIGPNPSNEMISLEKRYPSNIKILGWVDDLMKYLKTKSIFISPLFIGGGQRVKLLNALKAKIPIVSTRLGINGFPIRPIVGKEIIYANKPEDFIREINNLLRNKDLREKIARNGYEFLVQNYQWKKIFKQLEYDLKKLI